MSGSGEFPSADDLAARSERVAERLRSIGSDQIDALVPPLRELMEQTPGALAHAMAVAGLVRRVAAGLPMETREVETIALGALLHDVGKLVLPVDVLTKRGPLTDEEQDLVRQHPELGFEIVRAVPHLAHVAGLVRASHEWFDGTGYPHRIAGDAIPRGSRLVTIADAFDVMTQRGTYAARVSRDEAIQQLERAAGSQFDPTLVAAAVRVLNGVDASEQPAPARER